MRGAFARLALTQFARESRQGVSGVAATIGAAVRRMNLGWVRLEIGLLVGALIMGG